MQKTLILPLTKTPHERGRIGPRRWQDWYRAALLAAQLADRIKRSEVLILSNVRFNGERHEVEHYVEALREAGCPERQIRVVRSQYETVGQIKRAFFIAEEENAELIVISTFLHFPRVWWLCWGEDVKHRFAFGIPRPLEMATDIMMWFVFPLLGLIHLERWFVKKVIERRRRGLY